MDIALMMTCLFKCHILWFGALDKSEEETYAPLQDSKLLKQVSKKLSAYVKPPFEKTSNTLESP